MIEPHSRESVGLRKRALRFFSLFQKLFVSIPPGSLANKFTGFGGVFPGFRLQTGMAFPLSANCGANISFAATPRRASRVSGTTNEVGFALLNHRAKIMKSSTLITRLFKSNAPSKMVLRFTQLAYYSDNFMGCFVRVASAEPSGQSAISPHRALNRRFCAFYKTAMCKFLPLAAPRPRLFLQKKPVSARIVFCSQHTDSNLLDRSIARSSSNHSFPCLLPQVASTK